MALGQQAHAVRRTGAAHCADAREAGGGRDGRDGIRLFSRVGRLCRLVARAPALTGEVSEAGAAGDLLSGECSEGENDGNGGVGEGSGFEVGEVAPFEAGEDDYKGGR